LGDELLSYQLALTGLPGNIYPNNRGGRLTHLCGYTLGAPLHLLERSMPHGRQAAGRVVVS